MRVEPITNTYKSTHRKERTPMPTPEQNAAHQRYAALSQILMDALTPFVDAYERNANEAQDSFLSQDHPAFVIVTMADIRSAQAALRSISTDIYA